MNSENQPPSFDLVLTLDYSEINVTDLGELLSATNDMVFRMFLLWLYEDRLPQHERFRALERMSRHYAMLLSREYRPERHEREPERLLVHPHWVLFRDYFDESLFRKWVGDSLEAHQGIVRDIRLGNSIEIIIAYAALSGLLSTPLDYSMLKDFLLYFCGRLRTVLGHPPAAKTLESLPQIIEKLCKTRGITKFRIKIEGDDVDVLAEFHKRSRRG
jgi:hypothetical protein